ncbi:hypothetical protein E2C01_089302 [Portunus trituberculatus]|uniref:Uncharacterized protein n=1 Tax=Portunus trituberculatus TaxID=210409 RepID=A0A5B7JM21_PORTR|nr:hypothetical protein [Portunus trituberculatus]
MTRHTGLHLALMTSPLHLTSPPPPPPPLASLHCPPAGQRTKLTARDNERPEPSLKQPMGGTHRPYLAVTEIFTHLDHARLPLFT